MHRARLFVLLFCLFAVLFLLANFAAWHLWVADLRASVTGDLARMGYLDTIKVQRSTRNDLPIKHLELSEYRGGEVDVLTIGDSFSHVGEKKGDDMYQDYLATAQALRVVNVIGLCEGGFQPHLNLIKLINSGELDRIKPRYVLLETVERYAVDRLGKDLDFTLVATPEDLACYASDPVESATQPQRFTDFISTANAKYVGNNLFFYRLSDHNSDKTVYVARLRHNFFSVPEADLLVYWHEDRRFVKKATPEKLQKLNDNLNVLARMLAARGIQLVFMPVVDKANLYRDYLVDDTLPRSQFFELLRPLPKDYFFIDTKTLLAEELAKGEMDVFFADDTHWSGKAGKAIFSRFLLP